MVLILTYFWGDRWGQFNWLITYAQLFKFWLHSPRIIRILWNNLLWSYSSLLFNSGLIIFWSTGHWLSSLVIVLGVCLLSLKGYWWINFLSDLGCKPEQQMMYSGSKLSLVKDLGVTKVGLNHWAFLDNQSIFLTAVPSIIIIRK